MKSRDSPSEIVVGIDFREALNERASCCIAKSTFYGNFVNSEVRKKGRDTAIVS